MSVFDSPSQNSTSKTNNSTETPTPTSHAAVPESHSTPPPKKASKTALLAIFLISGGGSAYFLLGENAPQLVTGLFGGQSEVPVELSPNPLESITPAMSPSDAEKESEKREDEGEDFAEDEDEAEEGDEQPLPQVAINGEGAQEKPWVALQKIQDWRVSGSHDRIRIKHYFAHRKVWVRLAALEVAIKQNSLTDLEVQSVATGMKDSFRSDQMRRWLKRVEVRDTKTYQNMKTALAL